MEDFIKVSDKARERINQLLIESNMDKSSHFLRVGVKGGGCSGLSYELDFDDSIIEGDSISEDNGIKVVVDKKSLLYLFGTELNFSDGLNGKGFEFVNPNATRTCGCGESFSI
jgi:iron-sulfur cluster assembly protein